MSEKAKIIADAGSTSTNWVKLIGSEQLDNCTTNSINPYVTSINEMSKAISLIPLEWLGDMKNIEVFFYGAGCSSEENVQKVLQAFERNGFGNENVFIGHDLLGAGRALFNQEKGIACILGTGSSSASFESGEITEQIPALGHMLGDEGGGVDLGKRLLVSVLKKEAPQSIVDAFYREFDMDVTAILERIYFEDRPNKFLASFVPFIKSQMENEFINILIRNSFETFVRLNVLKYKSCKELNVGFVGSVAYHFKEIMIEILEENNLKPGEFLQSPMEGLIQYHSGS